MLIDVGDTRLYVTERGEDTCLAPKP